jgi:hypothetical protein
MMLKVVLFACLNNLYSRRKIENALQDKIMFIMKCCIKIAKRLTWLLRQSQQTFAALPICQHKPLAPFLHKRQASKIKPMNP